MSNYPKSDGGLWRHEKLNEKHPDFRGHIIVSKDQLVMLLDIAKQNASNPDPEFKLKIDVAMWNRVAKETGSEYKYLSTEVYKKEPKQAAPEPMSDDHLNEDIPF
tara:strand:- start:1085 stop:1399 length:315 start_codon:yes stop_codon:yes gene_type:complete